MEMERINENTIRVMIENSDLEERGITFLDLLGNHKQIENFFYSILEEVDIDEQFQETDAVTFQVLPNRNGLELFISKNVLMGEDGEVPDMTDFADQDSFSEFVRKHMVEGTPLEEPIPEDDAVVVPTDSPKLESVVQLADFEALVELAKLVDFHDVQNDLYKMDGRYYLHVTFYLEDTSESQAADEMALVLEYGNISRLTPEVLSEYGTLLMSRNALNQTKKYFK